MPGGFHPFHAGHMALYNSARQAFPDADLYVAATNSQEERPFPFAVKEKLAKVAGVEPGHFIQVKSPFQAKEITQNYNPEQDVLIFVRSEKDKNESPKPGGTKKDGSPAYFQPWTGKDVQPFSKHAYFAYLPTVKFGPGITSATEIRKAWPTLNDKRKTAMVMSLYPAAQKNPKLAANIVAMLDQVMGVQQNVDEAKKKKKKKSSRSMGGYFFPGYAYYGGGGEYGDGGGGGESVEEGSQSKDDLISTLNSFGYYSDDSSIYVNDKGDKIARIGSEWKHQRGKRGRGPEELSSFLTWGDQGSFAGDTPANISGATMKMIQVGDIVQYFGQKAEVVAMSKDRKRARITRGGITQDVNTSDLKQLGQGIAEGSNNKCPPATQDIELNLKNRQKAINEYGYGPLNPDMPNTKFWMKKVDEWNLDSADEAKQSLCGNCAAFDVRESTLNCIAQGIDSESPEDAAGVIDAGELGYCKFLKFKCASRRTCDAWVTGGPLTDKQGVEEEIGGAGGGFGTNYPGTYEQENGPFIHKGGLKLTSLTTESVDYLDEK